MQWRLVERGGGAFSVRPIVYPSIKTSEFSMFHCTKRGTRTKRDEAAGGGEPAS